jgi:hypothetical protein
MKSKLLFALFLFALLTAFKTNKTAVELRLRKTVSILRPQDSTAYTYTPDGKLASLHSYWSQMWQRYEYAGNRVISRGEGAIQGHPYTDVFFLGKKGIADSMMRVTNGDTFCTSFRHDKEGYEVEQYGGCGPQVLGRKRIIKNGNVVKQIFYEDGKEVEWCYFDYYDRPNQPTMFGEAQLGLTFRGSDSKNLLKKIVLIRDNNDTVLVNTPVYHFDDQGRISVVAIYGKAGNLADSVQYSY